MVIITIDTEKCKACGLCIDACPIKILKMSSGLNKKGYHYVEVDKKKCIGCGMCFQMCPDLVIEIDK